MATNGRDFCGVAMKVYNETTAYGVHAKTKHIDIIKAMRAVFFSACTASTVGAAHFPPYDMRILSQFLHAVVNQRECRCHGNDGNEKEEEKYTSYENLIK